MITVYSLEHARHNPSQEFLDGRVSIYFELPRRAEIIREALAAAGIGPFVPPREFGPAPLLALHGEDYLSYLETAYERWVASGGSPEGVMPSTMPPRGLRHIHRSDDPRSAAGYYCFDLSAPIVAGTYAAARASANVALTGAALLLEGESVAYALCRPPGHHAGRDYCGGYCFLNNAAIAAHYLTAHGTPPTADDGNDAPVWAMRPPVVALLDIDLHHGNGTQELFYERSDVLFVSIHADPAYEYPYYLGGAGETGAGAGAGYNLNLPLAGNVDNERFLATLDTALEQIRAYAPRYLVVSAGFDTFVDDPLGDFSRASVHFGLTTEAYTTIGARIAALGLPTLIVQEGGYATAALGHNAVSLLHGFAS